MCNFRFNGSFTRVLNDLYHRCQKAFFNSRMSNVLFLFDHTVKPLLMYGAEVVETFNRNRVCRSKKKTLKDM